MMPGFMPGERVVSLRRPRIGDGITPRGTYMKSLTAALALSIGEVRVGVEVEAWNVLMNYYADKDGKD